MADQNKPARSRSKMPSDPEAVAFGVVTSALGELDTDAAYRVLDHAAKMRGFYVSRELTLDATGQAGALVGVEQHRWQTPDPVE